MCGGPTVTVTLAESHHGSILHCSLSRKSLIEHIKSDDLYLLRRSLHYEWDAVQACCKLLVEIFETYADSPRKSHQKLLEVAQRQLLATDQWGNNALHAVCHYKPPLSVVTAILTAARNFPGSPLQLHTRLNHKKSTPLIIACATGASTRVIQELLEPVGLVNGGTIVSLPDRQANTPFLGLARRYEMLRKIPANSIRSLALSQISTVPDEGETDSPLFDAFWRKIDTLIQAAWFADSHDDDTNDKELRSLHLRESFISILHGAAYVSESLPPLLTDLMLRCNPEMVSNNSVRGILPLHLAVTADYVRVQSPVNQCLSYQRAYFIERLLQANPSTASCPVPGTNRSPLMQAIDSGLHWHIASWGDEKDEENRRPGPLQILWKCHPDALYETDPVTHLQPFMLAACANPTTDPIENAEENDTFQLDTIYSLLRMYPQALQP